MDIWQSVLADAPALVGYLVTEGQVDVDERNDLGETALHLAASCGYDDVVHVLLANGAKVALQDWESGWTALHRSMYHAHLTTSLLLLRHARQLLGRAFMKEVMYDTKDFAHQSAMQLASKTTAEQFLKISLQQEQENDGNENILPVQRRGGMVYTFGKVDFQLGYHLPHVNVQSSPRLVELPITSPIVQITANKFHTIALNACGHVYAWGFGKGGRLGTGTEFDHVEPTRLSSFDEIPIARVAAGENHTLALSRSGQVFSWGSNSFGQLGHSVKGTGAGAAAGAAAGGGTQERRATPKRVDAFKGMEMAEIAASGMHSGAICRANGFVYTWGANKRGQLGRQEGFTTDQPNATPKRVDRLVAGHALCVVNESFGSQRAVQLAMSDLHTCVVLRCHKNGQSHGHVWQFGYGSNVPSRILFQPKQQQQQRRHGNNNNESTLDAWLPRYKMRQDDILAVSCARNHSIALAACGSVYTWGHNGDALSHAKQHKQVGAPQRVPLDQYGSIVSICASQDHCAVVTQSGDLISWGGGPQGVLGHGAGNSWQPSPKKVHGAKKVVSVAAGHHHTVVLVAPQLPAVPVAAKCSPPKFRHLLETKISQFLDLSNVVMVWKYASVHSQTKLQQYCEEYMRLNWDALLEMGGKDRLDVLFDLMLSPSNTTSAAGGGLVKTPEQDAEKEEEELLETKALKPMKEAKPLRRPPHNPSRKENASGSLDEGDINPEEHKPTSMEKDLPLPVVPPVSGSVTGSNNRRKPSSKFISLDAFFGGQKEPPTKANTSTSRTGGDVTPWSATAPTAVASVDAASYPSLGPHALARPTRKVSVGDHTAAAPATAAVRSPPLAPLAPPIAPRSSVRGQEGGSDRPHVISAFSLDAFIKPKKLTKSQNKNKNRSASIESLTSTTTSWGTSVLPPASSIPAVAAATKTLKQIQEEEAAHAKAEKDAKLKNGNFVKRQFTDSANSWGLVNQQNHISLAELQQRQEEEKFLAEQFQILAQIEREQKQRKADEDKKMAKQNKKSKEKNITTTTNSTTPTPTTTTSASGKTIKQKKNEGENKPAMRMRQSKKSKNVLEETDHQAESKNAIGDGTTFHQEEAKRKSKTSKVQGDKKKNKQQEQPIERTGTLTGSVSMGGTSGSTTTSAA